MKIASLLHDDRPVLGLRDGTHYLLVGDADPSLGTDVGECLRSGEDWAERIEGVRALSKKVAVDAVRYRPLIPNPPKLLCLGLNDVDHAREGGFEVPSFPAVFARVASSLIGHREPMLRPPESEQLDYECELAVVIGRAGRRISVENALDHVAGYCVFNDGSIRDYQRKTSQWTLGKNFHGTGALGPELVTPDELPAGASGLSMTTRIGDELLQNGNTGSMIFDVAKSISLLSGAVAFGPGDVIAMGTPAGVGHARQPPRWMRPGEECVVAIERVGELHNPIVDEVAESH